MKFDHGEYEIITKFIELLLIEYMNVVQFIGSDQFWAYNKNVCILQL